MSAASLTLSGCVGIRLKNVEISQLKEERLAVKSTAETLDAMAPLSYAIISNDTMNQFLTQLDGYKIALDSPKGAVATIDKIRIDFRDGIAAAQIEAEATDRNELLRIKLRVMADIEVSAADSEVHLKFLPLEILPIVKVSIFRWRELWFVAALLRIKASGYAQSMPDVVIPIKSTTNLDLVAPGALNLSLGSAANLPASVTFPDAHLTYSLAVRHAVVLHDGIHVFLALDRSN
jgi:hypothetical protein